MVAVPLNLFGLGNNVPAYQLCCSGPPPASTSAFRSYCLATVRGGGEQYLLGSTDLTDSTAVEEAAREVIGELGKAETLRLLADLGGGPQQGLCYRTNLVGQVAEVFKG